MNRPRKQQIEELREQLRRLEGERGPVTERVVCSTGADGLDRLLPEGGLAKA